MSNIKRDGSDLTNLQLSAMKADLNLPDNTSSELGSKASSTPATQAEAEAGLEASKIMTALRTAQAITARAGAAVLSTYAVGSASAVSNTDTVAGAAGKLQAQINAIPGSRPPIETSGATHTLLRATTDPWTNNADGIERTCTHTAACVATFNFTGMVANASSGIIRQGGAGAVTLAGPGGFAVTYPPHISSSQGNSPVTNGQGGFIEWVYRGGTAIEVVGRSVDETAAGGAGAVSLYTSTAEIVAPNTNAEETVLTLGVGGAIVHGQLEIFSAIELSATPSGNVHLTVYHNSIADANKLAEKTWQNNDEGNPWSVIIAIRNGSQFGPGVNTYYNLASFNGFTKKTINWSTGTNNLILTVEKEGAASTRVVTVHAFQAKITRTA